MEYILEIKQTYEKWLDDELNKSKVYTFICLKETIEKFKKSEYSKILDYEIDREYIYLKRMDKNIYYKKLQELKDFSEAQKTSLKTNIVKIADLIEKKKSQLDIDNKREIAKNYFLEMGLNIESDTDTLTVMENMTEYAEFTLSITRNLIELRYIDSKYDEKSKKIRWENKDFVQHIEDYLIVADKIVDVINNARYVYCEEEEDNYIN